ncbi:MAG: glycosyltransferase family 39 protein [bacterium]
MTELRTVRIHVLLLWLVGLTLRVGYLLAGLKTQMLEQVVAFSPDSRRYLYVADYLLRTNADGEYYLFQLGPGYPGILAVLELAFGPGLSAPFIFSLILGSLAPVIIYLTAWYLLGSRTVALLAGLIAAVSTTSLALSCSLLTDQSFFTFHAAALLMFVIGMRTGEKRWFVAAGFLAGGATCIRYVNQLWLAVFVLIALLVPVAGRFRSRRVLLARVGLTAGIMLLMIVLWSTWNYTRHGVFAFAGNGLSTARGYWAARAIAEHTEGIDTKEAGLQFVTEDKELFGDRKLTVAEDYQRKQQHLRRMISEHPGWFLATYFRTIRDNVVARNYFPARQVPALASFWRWLGDLSEKWLHPLWFLAALAGLGLMIHAGHRLAWILLGFTFVYFTLVTGFSFWQGSRLHYPAEMAASICVVYLIWHLAGIVKRRYQAFRSPADVHRL